MRVTVQIQNLEDAQLCPENTSRVEHGLNNREGEWNMSVTGSRASETRVLQIEGPNGLERSYTLALMAENCNA